MSRSRKSMSPSELGSFIQRFVDYRIEYDSYSGLYSIYHNGKCISSRDPLFKECFRTLMILFITHNG